MAADLTQMWWKIKTGEDFNVSRQQINVCDTRSYGCQGGFEMYALDYLTEGAISGDEYPYTARDDACQSTNYPNRGFKTGSGYDVVLERYSSTSSLAGTPIYKEALKNGPLSISVLAYANFSSYSSGIMTMEACDVTDITLDHTIVLVGHGQGQCGRSDGTRYDCDYFIAKNSWGYWGESGFIRMEAVEGASVGTCAMNVRAYQPNGVFAM
jgi:hypothetical protein